MKVRAEKEVRDEGTLVIQYQTIYQGPADLDLEKALGDAIYKAAGKHGWRPSGGLIFFAGIDEIKGTKELRFCKKEKKKKTKRGRRRGRHAISLVVK